MKLIGVIVRRRVLGKHLAFCHVQKSVILEEEAESKQLLDENDNGDNDLVSHHSRMEEKQNQKEQAGGDSSGSGGHIIRVAFRRSSDAWDSTRDATFPTKVSRLPYGATVLMELKEAPSSSTSSTSSTPTVVEQQEQPMHRQQQDYDWEVCSWQILVHPNVVAQATSAVAVSTAGVGYNANENQNNDDNDAVIVSVPAYLRARGEMYMQLHPEKRPKKVKRVIQHPSTNRMTAEANPHGDAQAKCQRATVFCHWLLETWGLEQLRNTTVLDVAAGKGQLSIELACSAAAVRCIMVDPMIRGQRHDPMNNNSSSNNNNNNNTTSNTTSRSTATPTSTAATITTSIAVSTAQTLVVVADDNNDDDTSFQILGKRARKRIQKAGGPMPVFLPAYFDATHFVEQHYSVLQHCTLLVGLHPDQCTEAIVDVALQQKKSFAVVPCCVFGDLFAVRQLRQSGDYVRTYDQFLQYLKEKDTRIQQATLPVCGKNQVLYLFQ
jgi:hypothetical protein